MQVFTVADVARGWTLAHACRFGAALHRRHGSDAVPGAQSGGGEFP